MRYAPDMDLMWKIWDSYIWYEVFLGDAAKDYGSPA